jgi:hypothetical protein
VDRDRALAEVRHRWEGPIWALLGELEGSLVDLAKVRHADLEDQRAVGSVLNSALSRAAEASGLSEEGLSVVYCRNGQSNKVTGKLALDGKDHETCFELHLSDPRGGTSKSQHQFADYDIEQEPTLPGFELEAPSSLLFFIACHLSGTGAAITRAFLKFADGVDQRKLEIHRSTPAMASAVAQSPHEGPAGSKLTIKKPKGDQVQDGSEADKRGDAASSSQKA